MRKLGLKEGLQIGLLIGGSCVVAFVLQNFERWHFKYVLSNMEPEIVAGRVASVNLLPSNTVTTYVVGVNLVSGDTAKLYASLELAQSCEIGETIEVEKRGLDYRFSEMRCGND